MTAQRIDDRVLVLAPIGRDAELTCRLLTGAGLAADRCADLAELCRKVGAGAGAVVIAEEVLARSGLACLIDALNREPAWSDLPLIVLAGRRPDTVSTWPLAMQLAEQASVTMLERPIRPWTMLSTVQAALRARRRQYEVRDYLSELHAAQETIQHARQQADEANRAKDHFLAMLSHELRTPLTPALAAISVLHGDERSQPDMQDLLDMARRNLELEARLIDDLLDLTRIARGKIELNRRPQVLSQIIQRAVEVCMPDIKARQLCFSCETQQAAHMVDADSGRLQQVFWNLIKNAVKFTPAGGCVEIFCWDQGDQVIIEISDNGIGIEPALLSQLFQPFVQGERGITRRYGGLGLGLTISKAIVELHGGTLAAASPGPGRGATFTVSLPRLPRSAETYSRGPAAPLPTPQRPGSASRVRILLVEDHGDTAAMMQMVLKSAGYEVECAGDVATALQQATSGGFDLLLSDLGLPDGSGLDLIRELRARGNDIPGIALSGYGQEGDLQQSRQAGFAAHVVKPVDLDRLLATVCDSARARTAGLNASP